MPPPVTPAILGNDISRMTSISDMEHVADLAPQSEPREPEIDSQGPVQTASQVADPGLERAIGQEQISLGTGYGQAKGFAARHQTRPGKDWDLSKADQMLVFVQGTLSHIKKAISGSELIGDFADEMKKAVNTAINAHPDQDASALADELAEFIELTTRLKNARASLVKNICDGSGIEDPNEALSAIKRDLRVFRYQAQKAVYALNPHGDPDNKFGIGEAMMRGIQNSLADTIVSKEQLEQISELEKKIAAKTAKLIDRMQALDPDLSCPLMPHGFTLSSRIDQVLEVSHRTNDQIRAFEDARSSESRLRGMLGNIAQKGGSHKVSFSAGVGALIGLGFSSTAVAGLRAGGRIQIDADVTCEGAGKPLEVTFRIGGGLEGKLIAKAGLFSGPSAQAAAGAQLSGFVTRSYASLDDLILDAKRCEMATARTFGGVIVDALKTVGSAFGKLGMKVFRAIGRRAGDVLQSNMAYLESLKLRGFINKLDRLLARRANPVIVAERKGLTAQIFGDASADFSLGENVASIGAHVNATHQRDYKVTGHTFAPVAQSLRGASREVLLGKMRSFPDGVTMPELPQAAQASDLADAFDRLIDEAAENKPSSDEQWARLANQVRTLMIAVELLQLDGGIDRDEADRLLERFSNPKVKLPQNIYREYLMEGTGNAKPAKIRNSFSAKVKVGLFSKDTSGWTSGLSSLTNTAADSFIKGVADAGVGEFRKQVGLDTSVQYRFNSEKPAKPGEDPRPWENSVKTSHELSITASIPFRIIVDTATRIALKKGGRADMPSEDSAGNIAKDLGKDIGKDAALGLVSKAAPKLLLAGVKEGAKAAVLAWISNPENAAKLAKFLLDHAEEALGTLINAVEWIVTHPGETLEAALTAASYIGGISSLSENEKLKTLKWEYEDGNLVTFSVLNETNSKIGVNVDPVGVGIGVGFDLSYSVTDTLKERSVLLHPSLTTLMSHTEAFILANTSLTAHTASNQSLKNYLASNLDAVRDVLSNLDSEKNVELYNKALAAARGDPSLQVKLQEARRAVQALPPDAPAFEVIDAAHDLLMAMTAAYRSGFEQA